VTDKRTISLTLEEGFLNDRVRVRAGDREVAAIDELSTRVQIGLARALDVELEPGEDRLTVALPDRQIETVIQMKDASPFVGVSLAADGRGLEVRLSEAPRGYV
jgi:hypothetical protein